MRLASAFATLLLLVASSALARGRQDSPDREFCRSSDIRLVYQPTRGENQAYGRMMAMCRDGTFSYSHHRQGTCSEHGGVGE